MTTSRNPEQEAGEDLDERFNSSAPQRSNALSNKVSSILSASYVDSEIRDALKTLDGKKIVNSAETRRGLRLDVQKDVIDRNGSIIKDFGHVAEVCNFISSWRLLVLRVMPAIEAYWIYDSQS